MADKSTWQNTPVKDWTDEHTQAYVDSDEYKADMAKMNAANDLRNAAQTQQDNEAKASKASKKLYDNPRSRKD